MLNLRNALRLIDMLYPYIPDRPDFDAPILDFVGKILSNVVENNSHAVYLAATELMSGISIDELVALPVEEVVGLFTDGLIENHILGLMDFYRGIRKTIWQTKQS